MSIDQGTGGHLINGSTQILRGDPQKVKEETGPGRSRACRAGRHTYIEESPPGAWGNAWP